MPLPCGSGMREAHCAWLRPADNSPSRRHLTRASLLCLDRLCRQYTLLGRKKQAPFSQKRVKAAPAAGERARPGRGRGGPYFSIFAGRRQSMVRMKDMPDFCIFTSSFTRSARM